MSWRLTLLGFMVPVSAYAQLALFTVVDGKENPAGATFDFGKIALGDTKDVRFRMRASGSNSVQVTTLSVSGAGFSLVEHLSTPFTINPTSFVDVNVHFAAGTLANYSAFLQ